MKVEAKVELIPKAKPSREPRRMPGYAGRVRLGKAIRDPGVIFPAACGGVAHYLYLFLTSDNLYPPCRKIEFDIVTNRYNFKNQLWLWQLI